MLAAYLLTKRMLLYFCEFSESFIQCALIIFIPLFQLFSDPVLSFTQLSVFVFFCFHPFSLCFPSVDVCSSTGEWLTYQGLHFSEKTVFPPLSSQQLLPSTLCLCRVCAQVPCSFHAGIWSALDSFRFCTRAIHCFRHQHSCSPVFPSEPLEGWVDYISSPQVRASAVCTLPSWGSLRQSPFTVNSASQVKVERCTDLGYDSV